MKIVDILGDKQELTPVAPLQFSQRMMRCVRLGGAHALAAQVVELVHQCRVADIGLRCRYVFDLIAGPKAVTVAERPKPTLGRDTGPSQDDYMAAFGGP